jgi:hypothetical protein
MFGLLGIGWRLLDDQTNSHSPLRRLAPLAACVVIAPACAAAGLSNGVYRDAELAFRLGPVPEHWHAVEADDGDPELVSLAFHSDQGQMTVGMAARCHRDGDDVPLRALTQHLYLGFTDRTLRSEQEFTLDARAALRTEMIASLDGVPQDLTFVVMKKDSCVYDFWRVAAKAPTDTEFDTFVSEFQVLAK